MHDPNRRKNLLAGRTLQQIALCPGLDSGQDPLIAVEGGEHDGPKVRRLSSHLLERRYAIQDRHL